MSELDLDAIEARVSAATGGPWSVYDRGVGYMIALDDSVGDRVLPEGGRTDIGYRADAEFIAHSRTDVPALIARVRELEAKNTTLGVQRVRTADALDRVAVYGQRLTEMFPSHTVHAEVGREITRLITTNPLPSEGGPQ